MPAEEVRRLRSTNRRPRAGAFALFGTAVIASLIPAPPAHADGAVSAPCSWVGQVGSVVASGDASLFTQDPASPKVSGDTETRSATTTCPATSATWYATQSIATPYYWDYTYGWLVCGSNTSAINYGPAVAVAYSECGTNTVLNRLTGRHFFWVSGNKYEGGTHVLDV